LADWVHGRLREFSSDSRAPRGILQAAAVSNGVFHVPDAAVLDVDPYYGLPYDDDLDAVYPASLPEDPFPEALFADRPFDEDLFADGDLNHGTFHGGAFDDGGPSGAVTTWHALAGAPATTSGWVLPAADLTADNAGLIDQIHVYENFKCWAAGQQARLSVTFEARLRQEQADLGAHADRPPLAPKTWAKTARKNTAWARPNKSRWPAASPRHRGQRLLGTAKALVQMPRTLRALETGQLNEERVMYVAKETACLSVEDRTAVDEELAADTGTFTGAGTRAVIAAVRAAATRRIPVPLPSAPATPPRSGG
jgi:hypothetical protein